MRPSLLRSPLAVEDGREFGRHPELDRQDDSSNAVQERLTIVATIFLPLAVVTGFFGMNFAWLVDHQDGA